MKSEQTASELTKEGLQDALQRLAELSDPKHMAANQKVLDWLSRRFIVPPGTIDVQDEQPYE